MSVSANVGGFGIGGDPVNAPSSRFSNCFWRTKNQVDHHGSAKSGGSAEEERRAFLKDKPSVAPRSRMVRI